ncbi:MAG: hypothetical protein R3C68_00020 [Myxococcota bacterium]
MSSCRPLCITGLFVLLNATAHTALAARITDVADASDTVILNETPTHDSIDVYIGTTFDTVFSKGRITREPIDRPGTTVGCIEGNARQCLPVDELKWQRSIHKMEINGQLGIYHDLALTLELPIFFGDTLNFDYANGVDERNSSIDDGTANALFAHDFSAKRRGVGHLNLGARWAPFNDERDDTKPTWVLFFKWGMPYTASVHDPQKSPATKDNPGPMGDGVHYLTFGTAFSKRLAQFGSIASDPKSNRRGFTDPYVEFSITAPIPEKGRAPAALTASAFGESPSIVGLVRAGFEYVPFEDLRHHRQLAIDFGFRGALHSEGRNYSELSDPLGELTYTEQYLSVGGLLGMYFQATEFIRLHLGLGGGHVTEHFLTYEEVGVDTNGDGQVTCDGSGADQCNPFFSPEQDQIGFRFKSERHLYLQINAGFELTF